MINGNQLRKPPEMAQKSFYTASILAYLLDDLNTDSAHLVNLENGHGDGLTANMTGVVTGLKLAQLIGCHFRSLQMNRKTKRKEKQQ